MIWLQHLLPHHILSLLMHRLCRCRWRWLKQLMIRGVIKKYQVDMTQAQQTDITQFADFNAFFTRALKPEVRAVADSRLVCPVDGAISQIGRIDNGLIFQAKGHHYSVKQLLGDDAELASQFAGGQFATIYLSPRDYHRIHMPCDGQLQHMRYVPGRLFSVNPLTVQTIRGVFARNERLISIFTTEFGPVAVVMVGAIFVGSMQTVWQQGEITPPYGTTIRDWQYQTDNIVLAKGAEMGRFNMGSTVVLLLPKGAPQWLQQLATEQQVVMGQALSFD